LEQLNAQRTFETFCDVVIHVGNNASFGAHRCILAASSAKLCTLMFTMSNDCSRNVYLDEVSASGFKIVLEFIYTGILSFDTNTITDVLSTAAFLEMPLVVRVCEEFINSRRAMDGDDAKVNSSLPFRPATVAQPDAPGNHSRSMDGKLEHSLIAGTTSAWNNRFLPSADPVDDCFSTFEASFDQYYSSCKERGIMPVCIYCAYYT